MDITSAAEDVTGMLDDGLAAIDDKLQAEFDKACSDPSLVTLLNGLRGRYIFDKMRVVRATVTADDGSPEQAAVLTSLSAACTSLDGIQKQSAHDNAWINTASDALDKVFTIYGKLAQL